MFRQTSARCSIQVLVALTLLIPVLAFAPVAPAAESADEAKETAAQADERILRERAEAYFAYRLQNSMKLFDYYRPKEKGGPVNWSDVTEGKTQIMPQSYDIERIEIDGDEAVLHVRMKMAFTAAAAMSISIPERLATHVRAQRWERFEGTWYKVAVPRPGMTKKASAEVAGKE